MKTLTRNREAWNAKFAKELKKLMAKTGFYPICEYDWSSADYYRTCKQLSPEDAAKQVADGRLNQTPRTERVRCWMDEFGEGFQIRPDGLPDSVKETIKAAFDNGCSHGTVFGWEPVFHNFHKTGDVMPVHYKWEKL